MMTYVVSEGRLFGLTPSDWTMMLVGVALCGIITLLFWLPNSGRCRPSWRGRLRGNLGTGGRKRLGDTLPRRSAAPKI